MITSDQGRNYGEADAELLLITYAGVRPERTHRPRPLISCMCGPYTPGSLGGRRWPLPQGTRRGTALRPTSSRCSSPEWKSRSSGQRWRCCRRLDCATPTTRGLVAPIARHHRSPPPKTKAKVSCRSPSTRRCIGITGAVDRSEHQSTSLSRSPHPSVRGLGAARLLRLSRLLGRRSRNATVPTVAPNEWS